MRTTPAQTIADFQPGRLIRHINGSTSMTVGSNYGHFAIAVSVQHISNPAEWLLVDTGPPAVPLADFRKWITANDPRTTSDQQPPSPGPFDYFKGLTPFDHVETMLINGVTSAYTARGIVVESMQPVNKAWRVILVKPASNSRGIGYGKTKLDAIKDAFNELTKAPEQPTEWERMLGRIQRKGVNANLPPEFVAKLEAMGCIMHTTEPVDSAPGWSVWFVDGGQPARLVVKGSEKAMRDLMATTQDSDTQRWILADPEGRDGMARAMAEQAKANSEPEPAWIQDIVSSLLEEGRTIDDAYILLDINSIVSTEEVTWNATIKDTAIYDNRLTGNGTSPRAAILDALTKHKPATAAIEGEEVPADRPPPPPPKQPAVPWCQSKPLNPMEWPTPHSTTGLAQPPGELPADYLQATTEEAMALATRMRGQSITPPLVCICTHEEIPSYDCPVHGPTFQATRPDVKHTNGSTLPVVPNPWHGGSPLASEPPPPPDSVIVDGQAYTFKSTSPDPSQISIGDPRHLPPPAPIGCTCLFDDGDDSNCPEHGLKGTHPVQVVAATPAPQSAAELRITEMMEKKESCWGKLLWLNDTLATESPVKWGCRTYSPGLDRHFDGYGATDREAVRDCYNKHHEAITARVETLEAPAVPIITGHQIEAMADPDAPAEESPPPAAPAAPADEDFDF